MPETLPRAELIHTLPGRTRLRFSKEHRNGVFLAAVTTALSSVGGITRVEARPSTGSLIVWHQLPLSRLGLVAEEQKLFTIIRRKSLQRAAPSKAFKNRAVLSAGIGVLAVWQLARGRVLPPALTLAMYAVEVAGLLMKDDAAEGQPDE